jgi:hypothetical protein
MEQMNGEIRDRERVMRTLEKGDTPILEGYQIFHNYIRPHMALDGKTHAEEAGIVAEVMQESNGRLQSNRIFFDQSTGVFLFSQSPASHEGVAEGKSQQEQH